jgi:hypothetical protein
MPGHARNLSVIIQVVTVRLRKTAAKRFQKRENATALIWKILQVTESTFRCLKGWVIARSVCRCAVYRWYTAANESSIAAHGVTRRPHSDLIDKDRR